MSLLEFDLERRVEVAPATPHLKIEGVSKLFQSGRETLTALQEINLTVRAGEFVCLVGPSGCGKSTLLNLVAGLEHPDAGVIQVNGQPVGRPDPQRLMLFQEPALFPWLDVLGNVEFGLKSLGLPRAERHERAMKFLTMVHLQKFAKYRIHQLSGGMRQRVAIARALAINPQILLMDEPFTALDAQTRDILHGELQQLWAETGKTILFVTHNVREAALLADRIVVFTYRPGRIKAEFTTDHLKRPRHLEDPEVLNLAREVTETLRDEVQLALAAEYGDSFEPARATDRGVNE